MQVFGLPLGILTSAVFVALWVYLTPVTKEPTASAVPLVLVLFGTIPVHEVIHALVHPRLGRSRDSVLGVWPARMLFYAHYDGELSRGRILAVLAMPLLVLSLTPLAICAVTREASITVAFASGFNALAAGGDVFAICVLLCQVPSAAIVRNRGYKTYWTVSGGNRA
jgi:hypothetical protein